MTVDIDVGRDQAALQLSHAVQDALGNDDGIGAGALGKREADGGSAIQGTVLGARVLPGPMLERAWPDDHVRDVPDIDRPAVARRQQQKSDVGNALQRLSGRDSEQCDCSRVPGRPGRRGWRSRTLATSCCSVTPKSDSFSGSGSTRICCGLSADDVGEADIVDLGQFGAQLLGELVETLVRQAVSGLGFGDSVSTTIATSLMPRPTISGSGMPIGMRSMLARIFSCTRRIASSALVPTRKRAVTMTRSSSVWRVDVLDAVDALDDGLERLGDELDGIVRLEPVGVDEISTIGTQICGSSSRGKAASAISPSANPRAGTAASAVML